MTPLVSIVIPVYNRENLISETLDSILNQTYINWECLVIDDGSTDNTQAVVNRYSIKDERIRYYERPHKRLKGANSCRNYGLELSSGVYLNWFDSDDLMHPEKLQLQVEALQRGNFEFTVCQSLTFVDSLDNIKGLISECINSKNSLEDFFTKKIVWLTHAPLFRKEFILENSFLFDETLQAAQEWELFTRILFKCSNYHAINRPLVYYRIHDQNVSISNINRDWFYFLARLKIYGKFRNQLSPIMKVYLSTFFITSFKVFLKSKKYNNAWKVWRKGLLFNAFVSFKIQIFLLLALTSYFVFGKGDIWLRIEN
ncbi:glycosyltransferase family 2 protein [Aestuariivivens sediminicola]|uniref:glycosyltransferase family 2 protein n=1 Tax=Aestuariivivens sediminicola TaxID=2913560 RepID=UPI001F576719|nr:glycosyltransferase family 2 protein [Aestuariivivens sediminicola]